MKYRVLKGWHMPIPPRIPFPTFAKKVVYEVEVTDWPWSKDRAWGKLGGWKDYQGNNVRLGVRGTEHGTVELAVYASGPEIEKTGEKFYAKIIGEFDLPFRGTISQEGKSFTLVSNYITYQRTPPLPIPKWKYKANGWYGGSKYSSPRFFTFKQKYL